MRTSTDPEPAGFWENKNLPILADAIQDTGCEEDLTELRNIDQYSMIKYKLKHYGIRKDSISIVPFKTGWWLIGFQSIKQNSKDNSSYESIIYRFSSSSPPEKIVQGYLYFGSQKLVMHTDEHSYNYVSENGLPVKEWALGVKFEKNLDYECVPIEDCFPESTKEQKIIKKIFEINFGITKATGTIVVLHKGEQATMLSVARNKVVDPTVGLDGSTIAMFVPANREIIIIDNPLVKT